MASTELESAIPAHLAQERTQKLQQPTPDFNPPVAAYTSRFSESIKDIVMAIFGAQYPEKPTTPSTALPKLISFVETTTVSKQNQPSHWQLASSTDVAGAHNEVVIAYWRQRSEYSAWLTESGFETWWQGLDPETETHGWFKEVFYPPSARFETVFSNATHPEGVAHMQQNFSGPIREHIYWGSMRDRLPIAQTDPLQGTTLKLPEPCSPDNPPSSNPKKARTRVQGKANLAVIRSGQDWSSTTPHERDLYLNTMHPVLTTGMNFLRDSGAEVNCISNRFMSVLDPTTLSPKQVDKTFGLGYFTDLAGLEGWSKSHKTHLDIFGRFLAYARELGSEMSLRLFHEVLVLEVDQQDFEYVACHPRTGMLTVA